VERYFRQTIAHEQNHNVFNKVNPNLPSPSDKYSYAPEEGRADFGALLVTQFEANRPQYQPSSKFPDDLNGPTVYDNGGVWTATYAHLAGHIGTGSIYRVHRYLNLYNAATIMVGTCTDSNPPDGFIDPSTECPSNSFLRELLDADVSGYSVSQQRRYEISEVFREHVTDADPDTGGTQVVPWADELPNPYSIPPFAGVELGAAVTVSSGPDAGSLPVGFQYPGDNDTLLFLGRAGETYSLETDGLAAGVDTVLEVVDRINGSLLAWNDDCPGSGSWRSCITFSPATTKYYVLRATPYSSPSTGAGKTYQFKLQMNNDDAGDDRNEAMPFVANNAFATRTLNSSTDVDVFRVSAGGTETMTFLGCSDTTLSVKVEVLDASGSVVASNTATNCGSSPGSVTVNRGTWFLRVTSPTQGTGTYKLRASLSVDIDSGGSPWVLTGDHTGRVIGARFESGSDEDWYSYDVSLGGRYVIVETFGDVATDIEVYTPPSTIYGRQGTYDSLPDTSGSGFGHWMLRNDGGAVGSAGARLAFMAPVAGTYRFRVRSKSQIAANYYLMFEDTGLNGGWYAMP
jgi:hypothetical protein